MKHILIALSLLFSLHTIAQESYSIRGTLKDKKNGETLFGASVYLKGTPSGVITNEYGFFSLTAKKGVYTLVISYVSYTITFDS
ncbi:carboxypeptidase-like regulatory domain-containing protein [Confluentibacter sediminis]|uniref:carboxypeptidase-like regulatory domain-containing protein n=1 Tax=Confluentibacter sediminis TaxID=2219045 RepID=UPI000DAEC68B|nr:carboxypeptidase-like regulatory domain-containing protein [Confluentibacter sediminis]